MAKIQILLAFLNAIPATKIGDLKIGATRIPLFLDLVAGSHGSACKSSIISRVFVHPENGIHQLPVACGVFGNRCSLGKRSGSSYRTDVFPDDLESRVNFQKLANCSGANNGVAIGKTVCSGNIFRIHRIGGSALVDPGLSGGSGSRSCYHGVISAGIHCRGKFLHGRIVTPSEAIVKTG